MPSQKLYVGNLSYQAHEGHLREWFRGYGPIYNAAIVYKSETGYSRGYGFVELEESGALAAMRELDGMVFLGRNMIVRPATYNDEADKEMGGKRRVSCGGVGVSGGAGLESGEYRCKCRECRNFCACYAIGDGGIVCGGRDFGPFGEFGDFTRDDFRGLNINGRYYQITPKIYGQYHAYKVADNKIEYSGPSNAGTRDE